MGNKAFDRTIIRYRARPKSKDLNRQFSQLAATNQVLMQELLSTRSGNLGTAGSSAAVNKSGFIKQGFQPVWSGSGMGIILRAGLGFRYDVTDVPTDIGSIIGLNDTAPFKPLYAPSDIAITVPASTANPRIDLIEVKQNRVRTDTEAYQYLSNAATGAIGNGSSASTLSYVLATADVGITTGGADSTTGVGYKQGTSGVSPTAPTVTTGYELVGYVYVPGGSVGALVNANVYDRRLLLGTQRVTVSSVWSGGNIVSAQTVIDAPPGFDVRIVQNAHGGPLFWIYAFASGNAKAAPGYNLAVTSCTGAADAGEVVQAETILQAVTVSGSALTDLADAALTFPTALTLYSNITLYAFRAACWLKRITPTTVDYSPTGAAYVTITFDIPVL